MDDPESSASSYIEQNERVENGLHLRIDNTNSKYSETKSS